MLGVDAADSADPESNGTVRFIDRFRVFEIRITSGMVAEPAALSVAPVPARPRVEMRAEHRDFVLEARVAGRNLFDDVEAKEMKRMR